MNNKNYDNNQIDAVIARYKSYEMPVVKQALLEMQIEINRKRLEERSTSKIKTEPIIQNQQEVTKEENVTSIKKILTQEQINDRIGESSTFSIECGVDNQGQTITKIYRKK